jgi:hypothetical protein
VRAFGDAKGDVLMGVVTEGAIRREVKDQTKAIERTNELLTELLVEVRHANELTRWQIDHAKVSA